jgi:2,4-dienoyl-CoA reductase-like NADH-dependent reductase (Old Yellow Enzyme family)
MSRVFESSHINGIQLKNRIIRSATVESLANSAGHPRNELQDLYVKIAKGGVGAIITSMTGVDQGGKGAIYMNMIDKDEYIQDYRMITSSVHAHETPIIVQLVHAGRQTKTSITGAQPVAPSALRDKMFPSDKPREVSETEIWDLIEKFIEAIYRAKQSGFDGVQLHAAHGFLLSQFLSPYMNVRRDRWGGNTENRFRIIGEILRGARERVGDYPIWTKINGHDARRKGMNVHEAVKISKLLAAAGCDAIEVSCGVGEDMFNTIRVKSRPVNAALTLIPDFRKRPKFFKSIFKIMAPFIIKEYKPLLNYNTSAAEIIKSNVNIPVIVVGGIKRLQDIEQIIDKNQADFVAMSRPFIIEPDIVNKFKTGRQKNSRCLSCGYCALGCIESPTRCYYGKLN